MNVHPAKAEVRFRDRGRIEALVDELEEFRATLVATRKGGFIAGEEQLRENLTALYGSVNSYEGRPSGTQLDYMKVMARQVEAAYRKLAELVGAHLEGLDNELKKKKLQPIHDVTREEWEAERDG